MRSYTQMYVMTVFGVKYRLGLIDPHWAPQLYAVIANSLKKLDGVMPIEIGGFKDHVHILYSTQGKLSEVDIMSRIKVDSSKWINSHRLTVGRFGWQDGGGHFSYSQGQVEAVRTYIRNQWHHHSVVSFREEYEKWLQTSGAEYCPYHLPSDPE